MPAARKLRSHLTHRYKRLLTPPRRSICRALAACTGYCRSMIPSPTSFPPLPIFDSSILPAPTTHSASVGLECREFRRQLLNFFVQPSHLIAKLVQVTAEHAFSTCSTQKLAHGTASEVRHISFGGRETKPSKRRVLLFREPDADLSGPRIQDCHAEFRFGPGILDRDSHFGDLTNIGARGGIPVQMNVD